MHGLSGVIVYIFPIQSKNFDFTFCGDKELKDTFSGKNIRSLVVVFADKFEVKFPQIFYRFNSVGMYCQIAGFHVGFKGSMLSIQYFVVMRGV